MHSYLQLFTVIYSYLQLFTVIYSYFFIFLNPSPMSPVSECLQGLSSCTHACMDGGDGSRRCDNNSSSMDGLNQP